MSEYLLMNKENNRYRSIGSWYTSLTATRRLYHDAYILFRNTNPELFVLEKKYPYGGAYRLKKIINNSWVNSKWIETTEEEYAEPLYIYVEENMDKFISYSEKEMEEWGEAPSMYEWVHRNEIAVREFIFWMYDKGYIKVDDNK